MTAMAQETLGILCNSVPILHVKWNGVILKYT
jgi:hypothetical protein